MLLINLVYTSLSMMGILVALVNNAKRVPGPITYLNVPEPYVCPPCVATTAGYMLTQNWCKAFTDENLMLWQTGIYNQNATAHVVTYDWSCMKCKDSGIAPYQQSMVPLMYNRIQCLSIVPTSVFVDSYNRLIIYADTNSLREERVTTEKVLFIMEAQSPGNRGCEYKIVYQQYFDTMCPT